MTNHASFLPEDYLAQKAERRTNLISLVLFAVVILLVAAAFFWTNQTYTRESRQREIINAHYREAAEQIKELTQLEEQRNAMLQKADLAAALIERVPRSVLLAELINRMPDRLSLLEFELKSEPVKIAAKRPDTKEETGRLTASRGKTKEDAKEEVTKIETPRYQVDISMIGAAPTDIEVSNFMKALNGYPLLHDVVLEYSEEKELEAQIMRQFKIRMSLHLDADVRTIEPLIVPRTLGDPMSDEMRFRSEPSVQDGAVMADTQQPGKDN